MSAGETDRKVDDGLGSRELHAFQWADWFEDYGFERLVKAIEAEMARREKWLKEQA